MSAVLKLKRTRRRILAVIAVLLFAVASAVATNAVFTRLDRSIAADVLREALAFYGGESPAVDDEVTKVVNVTQGEETESGMVVSTLTVDGFEGPITMKVAVSPDRTVSGIQVLEHSETPDVGGMALQDEYLETFTGSGNPEEIDAYTGATNTSKAIKNALSLSLTQFDVANGAEYTAPVILTADEIRDQYLLEFLGEGYENLNVEPTVMTTNTLTAVYKSDKGYAMDVQGYGHDENSPVRLLVCFNTDGTINEIKVIEHHETEGFGANALKESYLNLYKGGSMFTNVAFGTGTYIAACPNAGETSSAVFYMVNMCTIKYTMLNAPTGGMMLPMFG